MNNIEKLVVVWSTQDKLVVDRMILMYAHAAKINGWFDEVEIIIWGPSTQMPLEDKSLHMKLIDIKNDGVVIKACRSCTDSFGITDELIALGYDVDFMGKRLTEHLKSNAKILTF